MKAQIGKDRERDISLKVPCMRLHQPTVSIFSSLLSLLTFFKPRTERGREAHKKWHIALGQGEAFLRLQDKGSSTFRTRRRWNTGSFKFIHVQVQRSYHTLLLISLLFPPIIFLYGWMGGYLQPQWPSPYDRRRLSNDAEWRLLLYRITAISYTTRYSTPCLNAQPKLSTPQHNKTKKKKRALLCMPR